MLTKSSIIFALVLSSAHADEYIMPEIPSEAMKVEALKLGYIANGFSMDGHMEGSIDVSQAFKVFPQLEPAPIGPPAPPAKARGRKGSDR
jgi:hypothetical protein